MRVYIRNTPALSITLHIRVVNNIDEAQEITQEVFLTVYRKLKSFKFKSSLKTWVYRIAVNMAIDYARKRSKEQGPYSAV